MSVHKHIVQLAGRHLKQTRKWRLLISRLKEKGTLSQKHIFQLHFSQLRQYGQDNRPFLPGNLINPIVSELFYWPAAFHVLFPKLWI